MTDIGKFAAVVLACAWVVYCLQEITWELTVWWAVRRFKRNCQSDPKLKEASK